MRALLILNTQSRLGQRQGDLVCRTLDDLGVQCERDPDVPYVQVVIAAGGDGTVIRAIPTAIQKNVPLGIVPLGTFNDLAHTLGIPMDVRQACAGIVRGRHKRIDVGRVNQTYFVNEASVGLSTRIARKQTPQVKQRLGFLAVIATTIQSLRETRPFHAQIEYEGRSEYFSTVQLTIANSARFGGVFHREDAAVDDGLLDLYSVEVENWFQALRVVRKMLAGQPRSADGLRTRRSSSFMVQTRHPHHIAADGEPAGMTPAEFQVIPRAIDVLVP